MIKLTGLVLLVIFVVGNEAREVGNRLVFEKFADRVLSQVSDDFATVLRNAANKYLDSVVNAGGNNFRSRANTEGRGALVAQSLKDGFRLLANGLEAKKLRAFGQLDVKNVMKDPEGASQLRKMAEMVDEFGNLQFTDVEADVLGEFFRGIETKWRKQELTIKDSMNDLMLFIKIKQNQFRSGLWRVDQGVADVLSDATDVAAQLDPAETVDPSVVDQGVADVLSDATDVAGQLDPVETVDPSVVDQEVTDSKPNPKPDAAPTNPKPDVATQPDPVEPTVVESTDTKPNPGQNPTDQNPGETTQPDPIEVVDPSVDSENSTNSTEPNPDANSTDPNPTPSDNCNILCSLNKSVLLLDTFLTLAEKGPLSLPVKMVLSAFCPPCNVAIDGLSAFTCLWKSSQSFLKLKKFFATGTLDMGFFKFSFCFKDFIGMIPVVGPPIQFMLGPVEDIIDATYDTPLILAEIPSVIGSIPSYIINTFSSLF